MTTQEFEEKLNKIRIKNGWKITLEFVGIWIITIIDKESNKKLAETGSTGIDGILYSLEQPLESSIWIRY